MDRFIQEVFTPYWVLSVFFVGVMINLASSFFQKTAPKLYFFTSNKYRALNQELKRRYDQQVAKIANDQIYKQDIQHKEVRNRLMAIWNGFQFAAFTATGWTFANVMKMTPDLNKYLHDQHQTSTSIFLGLLFLAAALCLIEAATYSFTAFSLTQKLVAAEKLNNPT